jgi:para-nitrobenzyl esterase
MTLVETKYGKIQGYTENGIEVFKGIPYAEAPIGELRFSPPVAKKPWNGILNALEYGPCAYQVIMPLDLEIKVDGNVYHHHPIKLEPQSEDCLYLNIWTPSSDNGKRPVMFFIHGGGFDGGTASTDSVNGTAFAQNGDVVLVTINYRLGALVYLFIPGMTANVGQLDQILALEWVRDNIHNFGGDPNNVTIFGGSAGGIAVVSLCAMPKAKGLFHRVIAMGTPRVDPIADDKLTTNLMNKLGVKSGDINALRKIPAQNIVKAQSEVSKGTLIGFRPQIDGETLPIHPLKAFQLGDCKDIDLLMGNTLDEAMLFIALNPAIANINDEETLVGVLAMTGIETEKLKKILNTYKNAREGKYSNEPKKLLSAIMTDLNFRLPTLRLLEAQSKYQPNTYNYLFTWPSPMFEGKLGSIHGLESIFIFNQLNNPEFKLFVGSNPDEDLCNKMMAAWTSFARNGNPNTNHLHQWSTYDINSRSTMIFGKKVEVLNGIFEQERAVWDEI